MPLDQIAKFVDRATSVDFQIDQLRARFHNIVEGLTLNHMTPGRVMARLVYLDAHFFRKPANEQPERTISALALSCLATDERFKETDHYLRPGALSDNLDKRAVTFQRNQYGRLGSVLFGSKASGSEIKAAFDARGTPGAPPFISPVGAPDGPLWLTLYDSTVEQLCEEAQLDTIGPGRRAEIVRHLISELGLCHIDVGDELIAFVTARPIGQLTFLHPAAPPASGAAGQPQFAPRGPTPLEARDHRRYRNWPSTPVPADGDATPIPADGYGRTYALDVRDRAPKAEHGDHGQPEAVRPRLAIADFADCIFLGTLQEPALEDTDAAYLTAIGANLTLGDLLRNLHHQFGI